MQQGIGIKGDHKLGIYMLQSFIQRIKLPGFFFKQDLYVDPQSLSRFQCRFRCFVRRCIVHHNDVERSPVILIPDILQRICNDFLFIAAGNEDGDRIGRVCCLKWRLPVKNQAHCYKHVDIPGDVSYAGNQYKSKGYANVGSEIVQPGNGHNNGEYQPQ